MTPLAPAPTLVFTTRMDLPAGVANEFRADVDDILEHNLFVEGVTRSGKTNLVRYLIESVYGQVLIIVLDVEGEYASLRSAERPFLVVGRGRDVAIAADSTAVRRLVDAIVEKRVSTIFDLSEYETEEQHVIVAAVCDALVALPETHEGDKLVIVEELQEFAPEGGGKGTSLPSVRRLAKRGLKRGVAMLGSSQRVADVAKGVITMLKSKAIGGTDHTDIPRALDQLGIPRRDRKALADLGTGEFWVKGPAFQRHAVQVRVPLAQSSPPRRRRGEGAVHAAEAPAEIAALAASLAAAAAEAAAAEEAAHAAQAARASRSADPGDDVPEVDARALENARLDGAIGERRRQERFIGVMATMISATASDLREVGTRILEDAALLDGVVEEANAGWTGVKPRPDPATVEPTPVAHVATGQLVVSEVGGKLGAKMQRASNLLLADAR